jgi:hypothetical protein
MHHTQRTLRRQLLLPLLILEIAALVIIGLATFLIYRGQLQGALYVQQRMAVGAAKDIEAYLGNLQADLLNVGLSEDLTHLAPDQQSEVLARLQARQDSCTVLAVVDEQGHEQVRVALHPNTPPLPSEWRGHAALQHARTGDPYNSVVEFHEGLPYMLMAVPTRDPQLQTVGMLVAQVDLSSLWDVVATAGGGQQSGYVYVVDQDGNLIAAPDLGLVMRQPDVRGLEGVRAALDGEQPAGTYNGLVGARVAGGMSMVTDTGWRVIAELPTDEAYAYLRSLLPLLGLQALGSVVLAAGVWFYLSQRVITPILERARGA